LEPDTDPLIELDRHTLLRPLPLRQDVGDDAGADGLAPFADRKAQPLVHRDRRDQLRRDCHVVSRHHHLHPRRQRHHPRHVRRPEIKLRPVPVEKRRVPPPHLPPQHIYLRPAPLLLPDPPRPPQYVAPPHLPLFLPPHHPPSPASR